MGSLVIFRDVLFAIPSVLRGEAVIAGDELVPFFNWHSQLLDQAAGQFNELVNGYEFRVRYAFLTTWAALLRRPAVRDPPRHPGPVLGGVPDGRALHGPGVPVAVVAGDLPRDVLPGLAAVPDHGLRQVTHFYTLVLGLVLLTISSLWMLYALLFAGRKWKRWMVVAAVATLFNPAIHYWCCSACSSR